MFSNGTGFNMGKALNGIFILAAITIVLMLLFLSYVCADELQVRAAAQIAKETPLVISGALFTGPAMYQGKQVVADTLFNAVVDKGVKSEDVSKTYGIVPLSACAPEKKSWWDKLLEGIGIK